MANQYIKLNISSFYRAEAYLAEEMYDEAVNDYRRALELDENYGPAKDGLGTAQKRQGSIQLE